MLVIASATGAMPKSGGLLDQDSAFIELLAWFIPRYDEVKFVSKCDRVLGNPAAQGKLKG